MIRKMAMAALALLVSCSLALAGTNYDVDIDNEADLGVVTNTNVDPDPLAPFNAAHVSSGDGVWLYNSAAATWTANADGIVIEDNAVMGVGFRKDNTTPSAGAIIIRLTDGATTQNLTIGNSSGTGTLHLGHANLTANVTVSGRALNLVDGAITMNSVMASAATLSFETLSFLKGAITMNDNNARLTISGASVIGHGTASADRAVLTASSGATFTGGLTVARGGEIIAGGATTGIGFGTSGKLVLAGGLVNAGGNALTMNTKTISVEKIAGAVSTLDATGGSIAFATGAALTVNGDFAVTGADTGIALQSYNQTAGDTVIEGAAGLVVTAKGEIKGGAFQAENTTFTGGLDTTGGSRLKHGTLTFGAGNNAKLRVGSTTFLDLSGGNLTLVNDVKTEIYGTLVIGENAGTVWKLSAQNANATVTLFDSSRIELTEAFINKLNGSNYVGGVIVDGSGAGAVVLPGGAQELAFDNFLYGNYTYALNANHDLILKAYDTGIARDGTAADYEKARDRIVDKYGPIVAGDGFVQNIYKSAVRGNVSGTPPYDRLQPASASGTADYQSYSLNMANFQAFARGNGDISTAGMYSGLSNSGVVEAAMNTAIAVVNHVKMRQRGLAEERAACLVETICPAEASPSLILDNDNAHRIWVGGFGLSEEADDRHGIPGYRYEPAGFLTGYDQAVGDFSFGGVYAYGKGDFADKSSLRHDSKISSHSFGLHGTYFHQSGAFATVMGGYTYSDNKISELRADASVTAGTSWHEAAYDTNTWHGALEIGYEIRPVSCLTVTPTVGFTYVYAISKNHEETLGGVVAGRVRGVKNHGTYLPAKLEMGYEVATGSESRIRFTVNGGYAYNFNNDGIEGVFDPAGFTNAFSHNVVGWDTGKSTYNAGAGVRFVSDRFDIGVQYDFYYKTDYTAHRLLATAGLSF